MNSEQSNESWSFLLYTNKFAIEPFIDRWIQTGNLKRKQTNECKPVFFSCCSLHLIEWKEWIWFGKQAIYDSFVSAVLDSILSLFLFLFRTLHLHQQWNFNPILCVYCGSIIKLSINFTKNLIISINTLKVFQYEKHHRHCTLNLSNK